MFYKMRPASGERKFSTPNRFGCSFALRNGLGKFLVHVKLTMDRTHFRKCERQDAKFYLIHNFLSCTADLTDASGQEHLKPMLHDAQLFGVYQIREYQNFFVEASIHCVCS
jgi:hypothetical protein